MEREFEYLFCLLLVQNKVWSELLPFLLGLLCAGVTVGYHGTNENYQIIYIHIRSTLMTYIER